MTSIPSISAGEKAFLRGEIADLRGENQRLKQEMEFSKALKKIEIDSCKKELDQSNRYEMNRILSRSVDEIADLRCENQRMKNELEFSKTLINRLNNEIMSCKKQLKALSIENGNLKSIVNELKRNSQPERGTKATSTIDLVEKPITHTDFMLTKISFYSIIMFFGCFVVFCSVIISFCGVADHARLSWSNYANAPRSKPLIGVF